MADDEELEKGPDDIPLPESDSSTQDYQTQEGQQQKPGKLRKLAGIGAKALVYTALVGIGFFGQQLIRSGKADDAYHEAGSYLAKSLLDSPRQEFEEALARIDTYSRYVPGHQVDLGSWVDTLYQRMGSPKAVEHSVSAILSQGQEMRTYGVESMITGLDEQGRIDATAYAFGSLPQERKQGLVRIAFGSLTTEEKQQLILDGLSYMDSSWDQVAQKADTELEERQYDDWAVDVYMRSENRFMLSLRQMDAAFTPDCVRSFGSKIYGMSQEALDWIGDKVIRLHEYKINLKSDWSTEPQAGG